MKQNIVDKVSELLCKSTGGRCNGDCENCVCIKQAEYLVSNGVIAR